ncbi:2'-5' RNA ligase family protein [Parasphingopyxis algicola]|uniref:2'-5' RNA ligase family protein n=1 Tax=Parasphingopyxis algicola TaxID=2026624 RepID=UPI0015A078C1|nr:2'-5' RNA ligase family protein [Parasphingopyxis algicola]QLC24083.1 2'-5' RNA ligase family protein [Parasphingopyxis algicola]
MTGEAAPIIVSALFGAEDFAWLNGLRRRHFPPERNVIDAHLTLFHHLPPSVSQELKDRLNAETRGSSPPRARLSGLMSLGRGVAFRVESPELEAIRDRLADAFTGLLTPQDQQSWRPHVTIQNKVEPAEAKGLLEQLSRDFAPRPLQIAGLASWYYRGGPWEPLSTHKFAR